MSKSYRSLKKRISSKKTQLPFIVHRAPIENHIAYEKKGHWTQKEKLKYVIFLQYFKQKFTSRDKKKRFCRIFKLMSDFIKTRTHNQCRSHHQKMEKQRFQVDNIIKNVISKYHPRIYKQLSQRYRIQIENLDQQDTFHKSPKINTLQTPKIQSSSHEDKNLPAILQFQQAQIEEKTIGKEAENYIPSFLLKNDKMNQNSFNLPFHTMKQPRKTRACESDSQDSNNQNKPLCQNYPVQNQLSIKRQQSLDFNSMNNFYGYKANVPTLPINNMTEYLQSIEKKKLQCLNRANFHYNQMQLELSNLVEFERQKQAIIQSQNHQNSIQNNFPYGISNFSWWEHSQFNNQC